MKRAWMHPTFMLDMTSPEICDYLLVFCPIESRVGTDISGAICVLLVLAGGKQVILVVMHHTMRPDNFAGDSKRHVTRPDIVLTVDCLFFEGRFLDCDRNKIAFRDIKKKIGGPCPQVPTKFRHPASNRDNLRQTRTCGHSRLAFSSSCLGSALNQALCCCHTLSLPLSVPV
uniref:Uncharacterized protein n=1 Tax=Myripristis murdjan TaxID=586833 RepID=A0A667XM38_9TELE